MESLNPSSPENTKGYNNFLRGKGISSKFLGIVRQENDKPALSEEFRSFASHHGIPVMPKVRKNLYRP